uniref:OSK domain-containing protein n=1 Tax=Glossina brevipalpis TaxID=37001 RepID=A0A1A9WH07_9MUSC
MTIDYLNYLEIRDEYPDIDYEIRGILLARAQNGATIDEIRDDYQKLTGVRFPVNENITDFLLTITHVMVFCNENGTRIFNIMPTETTRHLLDLVLNQKTSQQSEIYSWAHNTYKNNKNNKQNQRYYQGSTEQLWRHKSSNRVTQRPYQNQQTEIKIYPDANVFKKPINVFVPEGVADYGENNWYYADNCNHLYHRYDSEQQQLDKEATAKLNPHQYTTIARATELTATNNKDLQKTSMKDVPRNNKQNLCAIESFPIPLESSNIIPRSRSSLSTNNNNALKSLMPPYSHNSSSSNAIKSTQTTDSIFTDSDYEAHLLDFLLLGDDFFLYMARMELGCKFKRNEKVLQSGLCVSGQTVSGAIKRLNQLNDFMNKSVIINIGSVDVMQGRHLIQIEHDFRELVVIMLKKKIKPILTTVAPLANYAHNTEVKMTLMRLNDYIKRLGRARQLMVIDIWKCLVNGKNHTLFDCFQNGPRIVTGASESYVFWNKIGRQRVLKLIESQLEY